MSHWGRKQKHANVTLGQKAESGLERLLRKAESRAVDLPRPLFIYIYEINQRNCFGQKKNRKNRNLKAILAATKRLQCINWQGKLTTKGKPQYS